MRINNSYDYVIYATALPNSELRKLYISGADVRSIPNLPLCIALEYYKRTRPDRLLSESDEQENYTSKNNYVEGKVLLMQ